MENQTQPIFNSFQPIPPEQQGYYDDEINLMDYFRVIYKRRKNIIAIFLIVVIVAVVVSLLLPKTFEAKSLVRPGKIKNNSIESLGDIQVVFSGEAVLQEIAQKLNLPAETDLAGVAKMFKIEAGDGSGLLTVKGRGDTPEKALETVEVINEALINRHQELFSEAQKTIEIEVETIKQEQAKTEKSIEKIEQDISRLEGDIKKYEREVMKRADIQSEGQGRIAVSYINLLAGAVNQKEGLDKQILELEQALVNLDKTLQQKEYEKAYETRPTTIESAPVLPHTKIAPQRRQIVMIAGVLGIFIGIFWAFGAEYFSRQKLT